MNITNDFKCAICYDTAKCEILNLKCGHAFGKSCIQTWIELNTVRQKNCPVCKIELTNDEIKEINNIPLQERVVTISKKACKIFCRALCPLSATTFAVEAGIATAILGTVFAAFDTRMGPAEFAATIATGGAVVGAALTAGGAVGAVGAAAGAGMAVSRAGGAVAGVVAGVVAEAVAGAVFRAIAGAVSGAADRAVFRIEDWTFVRTFSGFGGFALGLIVAKFPYDQQRQNPIVL